MGAQGLAWHTDATHDRVGAVASGGYSRGATGASMRARAAAIAGLIALVLPLAGTTVTFYDEALPSTMNPLFSRSMVDVRSH
jgi:hypothetical protein